MTTTNPEGPGTVEARHLNEGISLVRADLKELREELRESLGQRPTHAEMAAVTKLHRTELSNEINRLEDHVEQLKARVDQTEEEVNEQRANKDKLQRHFVYAVIGGAGAIVGTNLFQATVQGLV